MHCTRFAPELSATSRTDRIWIMASFLHVLLEEADHDEALVLAEGTVLLDLDLIAGLVLALLVVRLVARARTNVLAVERVAAVAHHLHHDRLRHLRADDPADHLATEAVGTVRLVTGLRRGVLAHGLLRLALCRLGSLLGRSLLGLRFGGGSRGGGLRLRLGSRLLGGSGHGAALLLAQQRDHSRQIATALADRAGVVEAVG